MPNTSAANDTTETIAPVASIKERKIIFLANPISGNKDKKKVLTTLEQYSAEKKLHWEIYNTKANGNYDFIKEKIRQESITDVVIIGGDGSVNQALNALHKEDVCFGIIPYGSGNGLARAVGIPMNTRLALELILKGESKYSDAFLINGNIYGCMLTGLGFDAKVAHEFAASSQRGLKTYVRKVLSNFFNAKTYQFTIESEDFSVTTDAFFLSIANGNQFGNNFTIAPKASLNDGLLDIVIVQKMGKLKLLASVLKQITGNNELQDIVGRASYKDILYLQRPKVKIKNISMAPIHIDGEPRETAPEFEIEILRNNFKLIQ